MVQQQIRIIDPPGLLIRYEHFWQWRPDGAIEMEFMNFFRGQTNHGRAVWYRSGDRLSVGTFGIPDNVVATAELLGG